MKKLTLIVLISLLSSCASRPVLYPNSKLKSVGKERANVDVDKCMDESDEFLDSPKGKRILKSAGKGSFVGGAIGAVSGLLSGDFLGDLITGTAIGATAGAAGETIKPDQLKRAYVRRCLSKKGYDILGWD